ncbi:unnamed protein product [Macrosiphum euphorbiae]|uniref:Uncharacterized protein n=1 Tax=Macrosiphum euphorbiae TaxID=13131 RepID=A0AAV0WQI6_9HEMI|nr:unnamed protein product [Macrosiphum euphorbiae]
MLFEGVTYRPYDFQRSSRRKSAMSIHTSLHSCGVMEAVMEAVKYHQVRVADAATLNFEDLSTSHAQINSRFNSRPLLPCLQIL